MKRSWIVRTLWALTLLAVPLAGKLDGGGWDAEIYYKSIESVRAGLDPYAVATARQIAVHSKTPTIPSLHGPFSYVYSPITLPVLHAAALLPLALLVAVYASCYFAGAVAEAWVGAQAIEQGERWFRYLVPVSIFFTGLLESDTLLSGNIAFLLYGAVLVAAMHGVRSGRWRVFYGITLVASCFKIPLLSLLALPVLLARRQWLPAAITGTVGVGLFLGQSLWFPVLFRHYLQAVELQFSINRDFGCGPAGILSGVLYDHHISYTPWGLLFFAAYALPIFVTLLLLSRRYLDGRLPLTRWLPVLLIGVILLNPRTIEYDTAPLALPVALVVWRFARAVAPGRWASVLMIALIASVNGLALISWNSWKTTECAILVTSLVVGATMLFRRPVPSIVALAHGGHQEVFARSANV